MEIYNSKEDYLKELESRCPLPAGFKAASLPFTFIPDERPVDKPLPMKINLILLDEPTDSFGGVFTRNKFPGNPVIIGRKRLDEEKLTRGVLINNKISNVCAPGGEETAEDILAKLGEHLGCNGKELFPSSTGIIGWKLPGHDMKKALPDLLKKLQDESICCVANGIMTTDAYPKSRTVKVRNGRITAIGKGAGMIEPNMATMLIFILTDLDVSREIIQESLSEVVEKTFNCISVDSDQSTSDTALIFSSRKKASVSKEEFKAALYDICKPLAEDIVRNGEGTSHVIKVEVSGAENDEIARGIGKAIVNAPLVKTAIYGNDPNVGRFIQAIGDYLGNNGLEADRNHLRILLGGEEIFAEGFFRLDIDKEARLSAYLKDAALSEKPLGYPEHNKSVLISVEMGMGTGIAEVVGSDLSHEYVHENADYRT